MDRRTTRFPLILALAACAAEPPTASETPRTDATILGVERLGGRGPMFTSTIERFRLKTEGEAPAAVRWSASAGAIENDGDQAVWTLPDAGAAYLIATTEDADGMERTAAFGFDVENERALAFAVSMAAQGEIAPGEDSKSYCRLEIDPSDVPHVIYRNETHRQLWYARFTGGAWDNRLVDGPGFDIGGIIGDNNDLVVSASGVPHITYENQTDGNIWYATLNGSTWVREQVSTNFLDTGDRPLAIALDPSNGGRPTIAWSHYNGSTVATIVAYRAGTSSWVEQQHSTTSTRDYFLGGMAFDAGGTAWLTWDERNPGIVKWSAGGGFHDPDVANANITVGEYVPLLLDNSNQPIMFTASQTYHRVGATWIRTAYTYSGASGLEVDLYNGLPRIAMRRGTVLEMLTLNNERYWLYEYVDDVSTTAISFAVDTGGVGHTCYTKSGEVWFN